MKGRTVAVPIAVPTRVVRWKRPHKKCLLVASWWVQKHHALSAEPLPWTAAFSLSLGARHIASTLAQGTYAVCALEYLADRPRVTVTDA